MPIAMSSTLLQAERTITGVRFTMRDTDSRSLHLRPSDLQEPRRQAARPRRHTGVLPSRPHHRRANLTLLRTPGIVTGPSKVLQRAGPAGAGHPDQHPEGRETADGAAPDDLFA